MTKFFRLLGYHAVTELQREIPLLSYGLFINNVYT
jgi:hypothetical protein